MKIKPIGSNQTELHTSYGIILFSYEQPVAARLNSGRIVRTNSRWSSTTQRHINNWLGGVEAELVSQSTLNKLAERK